MCILFQVMFDRIGGLDKHLRALKEMIVFPLLYPEIFTRFKITPPRGVLFYGPPGELLVFFD
jgi:ATPase family AAA domain-containing protein 2